MCRGISRRLEDGRLPLRSAFRRRDLRSGEWRYCLLPGRAPRGLRTVLIASPYLPFPLSHGGAVRIFNLMKQAATSHDLVLMAFCDELTTHLTNFSRFVAKWCWCGGMVPTIGAILRARTW